MKHLFLPVLVALFCACNQQKEEYPNIADISGTTFSISSNDTTLVQIFNWATANSNKYLGKDTDPVGPWYEAALPNRQAFCMRDVSHQCIGEELNGHGKQNANIFTKFVENISEGKDFCSYWEIDKNNLPAPADYVSDKDFWYNLNANFDVMSACWRMYQWTGNELYINDPRFEQFFRLSANEYVDKWQLQADRIMDRPGVMHEDKSVKERKFKNVRGLPSYEESVHGLTVTGDLIATIYRGLKSYAQIQKVRGDEKGFLFYDAKANDYAALYNTTWWNDETQNYYAYKVADTLKEGGCNIFPLWFDVIENPERINKLLDIMASKETNVESMSYYPMTFYKHNRNDIGYDYLNQLYTNERRDYPEVASGVIEGIVCGLAGVTADAVSNSVTTLPRLSNQTGWVAIENIPVFGGHCSVLHYSPGKTTFVNKTEKEIIWRAMFPGTVSVIKAGDVEKEANRSTDAVGNVFSFVEVACGPGEAITAEIVQKQ